jgi:hypothetical protein
VRAGHYGAAPPVSRLPDGLMYISFLFLASTSEELLSEIIYENRFCRLHHASLEVELELELT